MTELYTSVTVCNIDGFEKSDACIVVRDHDGQQLAYVYFEDEPSASPTNKTGWCERAAGHSASA